jgi:predicted negative regulator of RcsB-dependent stress response
MTTQRLSRKEIKHDVREDAFRHGVEASYDYVRGHQRTLLLSAVAVVALIAAIAGFITWRHRREAAADELLGQAIRAYDAPVVATGAKPTDEDVPSFPDEASRQAKARELFEKLQKSYSGTGGAAIADVYLGRIQMQQQDVAGARKRWEEFVDEHPDHMLAAGVRVSLIDLDRRSGKGQEIVDRLRADLEKDDKPLPEDVLLFELGTTLEQLGRRDEARAAYQRVADEYPDSPWQSKAMQKVRELSPAASIPSVTLNQ